MTRQLDMLGMMLDDRASNRIGLPKTREVRRRRMAPLVDVPRAANADPETSHLAADAIKASGALNRQQQRVLAAVECWPGRTSAELASLIAAEEREDYATWRPRVARRLPELAVIHVKRGDARKCDVTKAKCVTWWPA